MASPNPVVSLLDDASELASVMAELTAAEHGWINLSPEIPRDVEVPATPNALAIFSKRGPLVPLGTWTAPSSTRSGKPTRSELGIQHGTSRLARSVLNDSPAAIPPDWAVLSDSPRRGIVVAPPDSASLIDQASWLIAALRLLCIPPQTGRFVLLRYE